MSLCRTVRAFANLAVDAVEAVAYWLDFSDIADEMWSEACDRLAEKEAEEEVSEPQCDCSDVFISGVHRYHCAKSSSPASASQAAGGESPRSVPTQDVERGDVSALTAGDLHCAAVGLRTYAQSCRYHGNRDYWRDLAEKLEAAT